MPPLSPQTNPRLSRALLLLLLIAFMPTAFANPPPPVMTTANTADLTLLAAPDQLTHRLQELSFRSTALTPAIPQVKVRVLLPTGYEQDKDRRYPVLYLFHGGMSDYSAWTEPEKGDVAPLTLDYPVIVVMPDAGPAGYYVDWFNNGDFGAPQWERFHIGQLLPWIDAHYRTVAERWARAVAGASMGGHGALSYAAKYPDLFATAAAFSGALDLSHPGLGIKRHEPLARQIFGSYRDHEIRWRGNSATDLAMNLNNTDVSLYVGDQGEVEQVITESTRNLQQRLATTRRPPRLVVNPGLGHTWENFRLSLADWLPHLREQLHPQPSPTAFIYSSIHDRYQVHGFAVEVDRQTVEFSSLQAGAGRAFILTGSGRATVTTPVLGNPGEPLEVARNDHAGPAINPMTLDDSGRLTLALDLGPTNPHQQLSPAADAASTGDSGDRAPFYRRGNSSRFFAASVAITSTKASPQANSKPSAVGR